jgi:hypothetical protein
MQQTLYKEAILCLMFAIADADASMSNDELMQCATMQDILGTYTEPQIAALYADYKKRFTGKGFSETAQVFVQQIPVELHMAVLSFMADLAVIDFDVALQEGSFISIAGNAMGISEVGIKTILLTSLSKKLLMDMNKGSQPASLN